MKSPVLRASGEAGLSLLEVLVVVAGIAIIASVGMISTGNVKERVAQQKLTQDVETINRAIKLYEVNGGDMSTVYPHPWWILGALKSRVTNADVSTGLTGRFIDSRMQAEFMTRDELRSGAPRAVWNAGAKQFVIINDNSVSGAKIARFKLTDDTWIDEILTDYFVDRADARDKRAYNYASNSNWVWDYEDSVAVAGPAPTDVPLNPELPTTPSAPPSNSNPLAAPTFSISGGSLALTSFPLALELANPNSPAISEVYFYTSLSGWKLYTGSPIPVEPGTKVTAFAKSTSEDWSDSIVVNSTYSATRVTLELAMTGPAAVTWGQVGGALMPGGPAPPPASPVQLSLANETAIPDQYESSANFAVWRTMDGNSPLDPSSDRTMSAAFSGGFPTQTIDISLSNWGTNASLDVRAAAEAVNTDLFNDSGVEQLMVGISRTTLRDPQITDLGGGTAEINLDASFGDMPAGARVYYTLDGTDPGVSNGDPVAGTEYTGPFTVKGLGRAIVTVTARAYGTDNYEHWFTSSSAVWTDVPVPPALVSFTHTVSTAPPP